MVEVHSEPLQKRYSASRCSLSYIFWLAYYVAIVVAPFAIAYSTHAFWQKQAVYQDQLTTTFNYGLVYMLEGQNTFLTWSSLTDYNNLIDSSQLRVPSISVARDDNNNDGITDEYEISIDIPIETTERAERLTLWLLFSSSLNDRVRMNMESLLPITLANPATSTAGTGASITYNTDMTLFQRNPISASVIRNAYSTSPLASITSISDITPATIYQQLHSRNETYVASHALPHTWTPTADSTVSAVIRIKVPMQSIWYVPSIAETFKWGWVQYLAALIPFAWLLSYVKSFVFRYQLLHTYVANDTRPPQKAHHF